MEGGWGVSDGSSWSSQVEDLVDREDVEGAISLLESLISNLESLNPSSPSEDLRLACALTDLSNLYSSRGFSTRADDLQTRAFLARLKSQQQIQAPLRDLNSSKKKDAVENRLSANEASPSSEDDDWEAVADRVPNEFLTLKDEAGVSKLSLEDHKSETPKRRGRGTFMYKKNGLYSDQVDLVSSVTCSSEDEVPHENTKEAADICSYAVGIFEVTIVKQQSTADATELYGTSHVLVLAGFSPSTRTRDLEKVFENFKDRGVVIRWVNDTVALAVFLTPSIAQEARASIDFPFVVRPLDESDSLLSSLSSKDLEPPIPRPKTSSRTAERLIAQGMGRKISTTMFSSNELKKQEEARRNRIITRQIMRDEAWGPDDTP